jgi:hypothetical protein
MMPWLSSLGCSYPIGSATTMERNSNNEVLHRWKVSYQPSRFESCERLKLGNYQISKRQAGHMIN